MAFTQRSSSLVVTQQSRGSCMSSMRNTKHDHLSYSHFTHALIILISTLVASSSAFTVPKGSGSSSSHRQQQHHQFTGNIHRLDTTIGIQSQSPQTPPSTATATATATSLPMSSLSEDPEESDIKVVIKEWIGSKLPQPPEDQLTISGDVSVLFLYSFIDHGVNNLFDEYLNSPETIVTNSASAAIESSSAAMVEFTSSMLDNSVSTSTLPVWFDTMSSAPFGTVPLSSALPIHHHITYAPAFSEVGVAAVILSSSWLLSGYVTGAFRFKNTLECKMDRALLTTAKTWILNSILMLGVAWSSDLLIGNFDVLHKSVGVTKADADYIFDCLSVLLIWRYIINAFFGYPGDSSDD